jgi:hypothetical protein
VCDSDSVEWPVEAICPELKELSEFGKMRRQVIVLPNKGLQDCLVIGHSIKNFGCREAITLKLPIKCFRITHRRSPLHSETRCPSHKIAMALR